MILRTFPNDKTWEEAKVFVESELVGKDTSDLQMTMDWSRRRRFWIDGKFTPPKKHARKDRTWRVDAKVGDSVKFPMEMSAPVGSEQLDRLAAKLMEAKKPFEYVYDKETCDDKQELMVWSAGWFVWWYLRRRGHVAGRATRTEAAKNAFDWLRRFKGARGKCGNVPKLFRKLDAALGGDIVGFMFE